MDVTSMPAAFALELVARAANASSNGTTTDPKDARPPVYKAVGIILAVSSGVFIGTSFVLKKLGLLKANVKYHEEAGEGYGYLKNAWWWSGMTLMIIGEICNFVAYAFVDAILVTPLGALSVVITTILSAIFLKERLSFVGKVGCFLCILGSVIIVANSPAQASASTIQEMKGYVISPGFLSYAGVIIVGCAFIALWAGPRYGKKSMLVYLSVCSLIGGLSVVATQGLGAAIVTQAGGTPQFNQWFLYVLLIFVITTLVTEIIFLNKALNIFNAALVTPTYYVYFTSSTIVTSAILFRGFKGTTIQILTIVMGFFVICSGVILLQLSKSSKDVPDAAVFKGDLDQIRTVAEQEEHESEPKADAIRGAAALIRSLSKSRQRKEAVEAKRLQEERLEPIGENEQVEWDGLRRRKTILRPGQSPIPRPKTLHPPLGLTHFPSADGEHHEESGPIFPNFRRKAHTIMHKRSTSTDLEPTPGKQAKSYTMPLSDMQAPPMPPIFRASDPLSSNGHRIVSGTSAVSTADSAGGDLGAQKQNAALSMGLREQDTSYKSPTISFAGDGATDPRHLAPTPPPHSGRPGAARRQFSFTNVFGARKQQDSDTASLQSDTNRPTSSRAGSIFGGLRSRGNTGPTEEERLGLVTGDSRNTHVSPLAGGSRSGSGTVRRSRAMTDDTLGEVREAAHESSSIEASPERMDTRRSRDQPRYDDPYDDNDDDDDDFETERGFRRVRTKDLDLQDVEFRDLQPDSNKRGEGGSGPGQARLR